MGKLKRRQARARRLSATPWISSVFVQLLLPGLTTGCVYALVALGFVLCANVSGVVNFAQGEYVMLGGMHRRVPARARRAAAGLRS